MRLLVQQNYKYYIDKNPSHYYNLFENIFVFFLTKSNCVLQFSHNKNNLNIF